MSSVSVHGCLMEHFPRNVEEYLEGEQESRVRHEYVNGYIRAMVGGSRRHNLLTGALFYRLKHHLRGTGCQVYASDLKVKAGGRHDHIYFYPDVMVSCGHGKKNAYVEDEPKLIVEVLSRSTELFDRISKLEAYTQILTLEEYLLVHQNQPSIDVYRRTGERWRLSQYRESDTLPLTSVGLALSVADIYRDVQGVD